jgi:hypothetical protein
MGYNPAPARTAGDCFAMTYTYKQWLAHRHNGEWRNGLNAAQNKYIEFPSSSQVAMQNNCEANVYFYFNL